jgi:lipopolysaccharide assembly outer membrane protein LptD (OstA)
MRKMFIVALVIVGAAITGAAQTKPTGNLPPGSTVTAERMETSKGDVAFSRNVAISMPGVTVTADSAIFRESSQTFELEGHVQLKVVPPAK